MKKLAYKFNNHNSEIITVNHALNLKRSNPDYWDNRDFYDIVKLRPMRPVNRNCASSSFSFKGQTGSNHGKGSKGVVHELVQQYLCQKKDFSFKVYGKTIDLKVINAFEEWHVFDPQKPSRKAFIDCCLELDPECKWYEVFDGKIGFEVTDTSDTGNRKMKLFKDLGIFVFELKIIDEWHIKSDENVTSEQLNTLKARIRGYLKSVQNMTVLSQPKRI